MKARRILFGVGLLALAGGLVGRKMGIIPYIDIPTIILGVVCVILIGDGLKHRNFFLILLPLAFIASRLVFAYSGHTVFEAMGIAAIAAAGLTVLFGKKRKSIGSRNRGYINYNGTWGNNGAPGQPGGFGGAGGQGGAGGTGTEIDKNRFVQQPGFRSNGEPVQDNFGYPDDDGDNVVIENGFGKLTRYLHSSNLKKVKIDNGFGNCIVYYDNVYVDQDGSKLEIDNGFGQVDVYIPPFYRFKMKQDNGFGSINVYGNCSMDPNAPLIDADIDNGMGKVNIYFG
ncbi:MAG: hypothetical protein IKW90_13180 [Lachnospiraceae bacterium]|nr:hypothetical protein [Lachnospiraceae bacterium]